MEVHTTKHFKQLETSDKRISVHQGSTSSGKTYNILLWWISKLMREENRLLTIARKTLPALKKSAYKDFLNIINHYGWYDVRNHNKTDLSYTFGTSMVEFIGLDQAQKRRGARRDYLFINEANEITQEDWRQLSLRTKNKIVLDYNPSDEFHFIYDEILTRDDCDFTITTYKDNPYLDESIVREIERYKEIDPNYWQVYGLGQRGVSEATIFRNFELIDDFDAIESREIVYGLDFGYNDPTAMVAIKVLDREVPEIYCKQLIYKSYLTSDEVKQHCKDVVHSPKAEILGDNARPEIIEDIRRGGLNIRPSYKSKNSVKDSIDFLKKHKIYIDKGSTDLIKEMRMYKWKVHSDGRILDEPVDINNHLVDALRYAAYRDKKKTLVVINGKVIS